MLPPVVSEAARELGLVLDAGEVARLDELLDLWSQFRGVVNLVGSDLESQVAESLQTVALVRQLGLENGTWLDVGSGGGFPGLVMAALLAGRGTLVEPRERRAAFLWNGLGVLARTDCEVVRGRLTDSGWVGVSGEVEIESADVVSARAVFSPERWLSLAWRCVGSGGVCLAHVGRGQEIDSRRPVVGCVSWRQWSVLAFRGD